jgi:hypothetical protein
VGGKSYSGSSGPTRMSVFSGARLSVATQAGHVLYSSPVNVEATANDENYRCLVEQGKIGVVEDSVPCVPLTPVHYPLDSRPDQDACILGGLGWLSLGLVLDTANNRFLLDMDAQWRLKERANAEETNVGPQS